MSRAEPSGVAALLHDYRLFAGARLWLALLLMLLGALAEGFGILLLVPLATIAIGGGSQSGVLAQMAGLGSGIPNEQRFMFALALFVFAMVARAALLFARDLQLARLQSGYEASLRLRAAATLAARGWSFASRIGQSGMQSLLLTDVPRSILAVSQAQQFAVASVMLMVQLTLAALLSPTLTLIALAILLAGSLISIGWTRRGVRSGLALVGRAEESAGSGFRLHAGLKAALAQGTVAQFLAEYGSSLDRAKREWALYLRDLSAARTLTFAASAFAAALLLFIGYRVLGLAFPLLVTSLVLFARMAGPAQQLQQAAQNIATYSPSFHAIERRLGKLEHPGEPTSQPTPLGWKEFRADGVGLEHRPGLGVQGVSFVLKRGDWLGLAGPSGSGKTTLVDLAAGLLPPQSGRLAIDGQPLDGTLLEHWRAGLAYAGQEGSVFDDSVRGNLLADGSTAQEESLWAALELVGLGARIRAMPGGLDERVGDRGSQLSGGERQRLVIARALLRKPSLIILDEATAALDAEAEAALLERLRNLDPRPAAIVVAHRESTLAHCDSVLEIRNQGEFSGDQRLEGDELP